MTNHEEQSGRAEVLPLAIMWRNPQGFVQAQLRLRKASHPYYGWAEQSRSKSPDFFDVEKFPSLHFNSSDIRIVRDGELSVEGDLTVHGITRKVRFMVEGPTPPTKDPWGNTRIAISATTKINREDFGLTWNAALETGGILVADEVTITLDVEFINA